MIRTLFNFGILIHFILCFVGIVFTQSPIDDTKYDLKGKVCKVLHTWNDLEDSEYSYIKTMNYNQKKMITSFSSMGLDGNIQYDISYKYNENDKIIQIQYSNVSADWQSLLKDYKYSYDQNQRIIRDEEYTKGHYLSRRDWIYNSSGQLFEKRSYSSDGTFISKTEFTYNEIGMISTMKSYLSNGEQISYVSIIYNKRNLPQIYKSYKPNGDLAYEIYREYDKFDNEIKSTSSEGRVTRFEYEYDMNNNWIRKTHFYSNDKKYIETRIINYFN